MARIHWSVYIIIGTFVSVVSRIIDYDKLIFFFYVGIIFILAGIIKLVFNIKKEDKSKGINHKNIHQARQRAQYPQRLKRCFKCGNVMKLQDRFCSRCGAHV